MDHAEALERIEIAAAEPEGLERLMAGDTADAAAVAGHLAGCESCAAQLVAIRRTAALARHVIEAEPDPELKERTLAFIREVGRDRSGGGVASRPWRNPTGPAAQRRPDRSPRGAARPRPARTDPPVDRRRRGRGRGHRCPCRRVHRRVAAAAGRDSAQQEFAVLRETAQGTVRVGAQPDAAMVPDATSAAPGAEGTVLFSGTSGELVMVATGLAAPPAGMEYGCWLETAGERRRIGKLYPGGDLHAWVGPVAGLGPCRRARRSGSRSTPIGGGSGQTVLTGEVQGSGLVGSRRRGRLAARGPLAAPDPRRAVRARAGSPGRRACPAAGNAR